MEGGELLCDLIFSVNEACYEWKAFPATINSTDTCMGFLSLGDLRAPAPVLGGGGQRGGSGGDSLVFPDLIVGLIPTLHTTLRGLFSPHFPVELVQF